VGEAIAAGVGRDEDGDGDGDGAGVAEGCGWGSEGVGVASGEVGAAASGEVCPSSHTAPLQPVVNVTVRAINKQSCHITRIRYTS